MRLRTFLGFGLILFGLASPAWAQETYVSKEQQKSIYDAAQLSPTPEVSGVINLYQSILSYKLPKEFVPAFKNVSASGFLLEFVPFGQDVRGKWSEMLTITATPAALAGNMPPSSLAVILLNGMMRKCPNSYVGEDLGAVSVEGAQAHRIMFGCMKDADQKSDTGELAIVQIIQRKGDFITVQFARRGKYTKTAPLLGEDKKRYYLSLLDGIMLSQNLASVGQARPTQPSN